MRVPTLPDPGVRLRTRFGSPSSLKGSFPFDAQGRRANGLDSCSVGGEVWDTDASTRPTVRGVEPRPRPTKPAEILELEPGLRIGRYVIIDRLGSGGMGVVYRAYDPELNRRVALKFLRTPKHNPSANAEDTLRLQREAQALARVTHPNVVSVFDVGTTVDGSVFVAMEFIEGRSLDEYCRDADWREVLRVFRLAAEGVAACHDSGLVHRDLKPSNILVDERDQPVVLDFGLARVIGEPTQGDDSKTAPNSASTVDLLASPLTCHRVVMGTPIYMSPEQAMGEAVDAASDQFSLCLALYHLLYGQRPFEGSSHREVTLNAARGLVLSPPRDTRVPGWVFGVLRRGLEARPERRWSSMRDLAQALDRDPAPARKRLLGMLGGGMLVLGLGVGSAVALAREDVDCSPPVGFVRSVWNEDARVRLVEAFEKSEVHFASDAVDDVVQVLDRYAVDLADGYRRACEDTSIHGRYSVDVLDLRMACIDQARLGLTSFVASISRDVDLDTVTHANAAVRRLPAIDSCDDVQALQTDGARRPADPRVDREVAELSERLRAARTEHDLGRLQHALEETRKIAEAAETVGFEPFEAQVLGFLAKVESDVGDTDAAVRIETRALESAARSRDFDLMAEILTRRLADASEAEPVRGVIAEAKRAVILAGEAPESSAQLQSGLAKIAYLDGDFDEAQRLYRRAAALYEDALGPEHPLTLFNRNGLAAALWHEGDYDGAEELMRELIEIETRSAGPRTPFVASKRHDLGATLRRQGRYEEAVAEHRAALDIQLESLGPEHPEVGKARGNLASALDGWGQHEAALVEHRRAIDIFERTLGENHSAVATCRTNLSTTLEALGQLEEAETELREAIRIYAATLGESHPYIAAAHNNLATNLRKRGLFAEAEAQLRKAESINIEHFGDDHVELATVRLNLALTLEEQGRLEEAERLHRRALEIFDTKLGPNHPTTGTCRNNLAVSLKLQGRLEEALDQHRQAIDSLTGALPPEHPTLATARLAFARTLIAKGDEGRARAQVMEVLSSGLPDDAPSLGEAEQLLERVSRIPTSR